MTKQAWVLIVIAALLIAGGIFFVRFNAPPMPPAEKGIVQGKVVLGPVCPVERIPPDPKCAPQPYVTTIQIQPTDPSMQSVTVPTDASGAFNVSLIPGTYVFHAQTRNNAMLPRCSDTQVTIVANAQENILINCDTGIR